MWNGMMGALTWWDYFNVFGYQGTDTSKSDEADSRMDTLDTLDSLSDLNLDNLDSLEDYEYYDNFYQNLEKQSQPNEYVPFSDIFQDRKISIFDNFRKKREANRRLAFVHYVFPRNSAEHFKKFHETSKNESPSKDTQ